MADLEHVRYSEPAAKVARIVLDRAEARNAQNVRMLYELNSAFDRAAADDDISVIILAAEGKHFSSGHDLRELELAEPISEWDPVGTWCGFACAGAEGRMAQEKELYLGLSERWRTIPKPTIAQVQGKVISGGLMLVWPCDLIVASEDAEFADNTVAMGVSGAEFFNHPWELGHRQAKEMLFTSDFIDAETALRLGMVNHVVPLADLSAYVLELAERIARKPLFALKLAKEAVNAAQDASGRTAAMQTAFALHQLCHAHNVVLHGQIVDPSFLSASPVRAVRT